MDKLISIVIPCYNVEPYIDRCLRSLVRQTIGIENLELILVDDASTDATAERIHIWKRRFPDSIRLISLPVNRRQGGARNEGLAHSNAAYIGFVDSDDWVEETMYEKLYQKIKEYGCDLVCSRFLRDWGDGISKKSNEEDVYQELRTKEDRKAFFFTKLHGGIWSKLYSRKLILESKAEFPENLAYEDNYWMAMIRLHIKSYYILQEELYHYFVNLDSTILKQDSEHHLDRMKIEEMKLSAYRERGLYELFEKEIEYEFLRLYYVNTMHIMLTRFENFPKGVFTALKEEVHKQFPQYKRNPYLGRFHEVEQAMLQTIELEYDELELKALSERYKALYL